MYTVGHSRCLSTGVYLPEARVTSEDLMAESQASERFGYSPRYLERITGISQRRRVAAGIKPSDMAVIAARQALDRAQVRAQDIDMIIYAGMIRDFTVEPSTAHVVQAELGATRAHVLDVSNACLTFVNGVHIMDAMIATGQARRGLVVTGEQGSQIADRAISAMQKAEQKEDFQRLLCCLTLGDAGAAFLMGPKQGPDTGFMGFYLCSAGQHAHLCYCDTSAERTFTDMAGMVAAGTPLQVDAFHALARDRLKWAVDDIDQFIAHQVGGVTFRLYPKHLGIPPDIMSRTVHRYGNLISATVPVNLHELVEAGRAKPGEKVYIAGAGSGISAGHIGLVMDTG